MGYRMHVIKVKEEYGNIEAFNCTGEDFAETLDTLGCDCQGQDGYRGERFECLKEKYRDAVTIVKYYVKHGISDQTTLEDIGVNPERENEIDLDDVPDAIEELCILCDYTKETLLEIMEDFLEEADPEWEYIKFVAF
jgi:hypothetical protein